jgi:hypothetical protein
MADMERRNSYKYANKHLGRLGSSPLTRRIREMNEIIQKLREGNGEKGLQTKNVFSALREDYQRKIQSYEANTDLVVIEESNRIAGSAAITVNEIFAPASPKTMYQ